MKREAQKSYREALQKQRDELMKQGSTAAEAETKAK